jgi:hypothetical protein
MKRKTYEKPTTKVVLLQQQSHILALSESSVQAQRNGYGDATTEDWE